MRSSRRVLIVSILAVIGAWEGCGGGGGATSAPVKSPVTSSPVITSFSPDSADAGGPAFSLQVTGRNFVNGAVVRWNGSARTTLFNSSSLLTAQILAADIASAGTVQITVANPDGGTSNTVSYSIVALQINSIQPTEINALSPAFTLTVNGTDFDGSTEVFWNNTLQSTQFVNGTTITALIDESEIGTEGVAQVTVKKQFSGAVSNAVNFTILPPVPLKITTSRLPAIASGKFYSFGLQSTRRQDIVQWSIVNQSLPPGLMLDVNNGLITGNVPQVSSDTTYTFDVKATSTAPPVGDQDTKTLAITVTSSTPGRDDTCARATTISNGTIRASISPYGDLDVYAFDGTAGQKLRIETSAQRLTIAPSSRLDTVVQLLDSSCNQLTFNDDIDLGVVTDSLIDGFTLPYTGTYYIRVMDFRGDGRPDFKYDLTLTGAN